MNHHHLSDDLFENSHYLNEGSQLSQQNIRQALNSSIQSTHTFTMGDGLIRRKPSRDIQLPKKADVSENCSTHDKVKQIMMNGQKINRSINVGVQLKRLENNLISSKLGPTKYQKEGRQRKVMMRLEGQKQNMSLESMKVTSQQLSKLEHKDQHLKQILLALQRFYEKQQDKNQHLEEELSTINTELDLEEQCINSQKQQITNLRQKWIEMRQSNLSKQLDMLAGKATGDNEIDRK